MAMQGPLGAIASGGPVSLPLMACSGTTHSVNHPYARASHGHICHSKDIPVGGLRGPAAAVDAPVGRPPDDETR